MKRAATQAAVYDFIALTSRNVIASGFRFFTLCPMTSNDDPLAYFITWDRLPHTFAGARVRMAPTEERNTAAAAIARKMATMN